MNGPSRTAAWIVVAGGLHTRGGMDRANAELARHLAGRGMPVHLVAHDVDEPLATLPGVSVHRVGRPGGSVALGEWCLERRARRVIARVRREARLVRVLGNGGTCTRADVNWAHCVHAAWPPADRVAPLWFRSKNRLVRAWFRRRERRAFGNARVVIANSERTRRDLVACHGLPADRIRVVYLGADPGAGIVSEAERVAARVKLGIPQGRRVAVFVGSLDHDQNKGFDTLWRACRTLYGRLDWDVDLIAAGGGRQVPIWREEIRRAGLAAHVRVIGFFDRIPLLLAAADLLVSPVRYEAYGLNVHEALCRGVPAIVSAGAGIAERYPADLRDLLLEDPEDAGELIATLVRWRREEDDWRLRVKPLARDLALQTWDRMAAAIVMLAEHHLGMGADGRGAIGSPAAAEG